MSDSFTGKSVVITGAASGIGRALARAAAAQGARLLLADVDDEPLAVLAQALQADGASCLAQPCDVARPADLQALADTAQRAFGGTDLLINNAGVSLVSPVAGMPLADAHWLMDINFWGVVHGCQAFMPQLQARPGSTIVNLSSVFAMVSMPTQGLYNASKAAVRAFSDALREELRDSGVNLLCVHPGGVRTAIARRARLGDIRAVADSPEALQAQFDALARTTPEQAASAILSAVLQRRTRLLIGADARLGDGLFRLAPAHASAWVTRLAQHQRKRTPPAKQRS